jgi:hypothetical protein
MIEVVAGNSGRWCYKTNLDKVKINKMEYKENEDNDTGMEHVLRKERCFRTVAAHVASWPCCAILTREKQSEKDMEQKSGEEDDLKAFDKGIGGHEGCCVREHTTSIIFQQHKIDTEMHTQKCNQKKSGKRHKYLSGNGRKHEHDVHTMVISMGKNCGLSPEGLKVSSSFLTSNKKIITDLHQSTKATALTGEASAPTIFNGNPQKTKGQCNRRVIAVRFSMMSIPF